MLLRIFTGGICVFVGLILLWATGNIILAMIGTFPPDAYIRSANTAYDMSNHTFACHMSGSDKPATCAGLSLRGAHHNLSYRLMCIKGTVNPDEISNPVELYDSYRDMAIANDVDPHHPGLKECR